ncbi:MAG: DUF3857 domain-containing protein [Pseudomonadota bacterium]
MTVSSVASFGLIAAIVLPVAAHAGDKPLYQPVPDWVVPAPSIDPAKLDANAPVLLVLDNQQRLQDGRVWTYVDTATRVASPEVMQQLGTIAIPWLPDQGDLIVHSAEILRGMERIDLLAGGDTFQVLRREQQLERRVLDGTLTATMAAEGLRVGDVLRLRLSITKKDGALKGELQSFAPVPTEPFRAQFARSRLSWPVTSDVKWRTYADGVTLVPKDAGGFRTIELTLPVAKQPDLPSDVPGRFQRPPILEATSFADWAAVSRVMAPLYATEGTIAPGSAMAGEVAKIAKAESDPLRRAAAALQLVQEQVRYLALGMNGGNYVPQSPARTWELRYGDCKAKTLLLMAMLREMGITAEAVLVSSEMGDLVSARLPMPAAFDHVIVRAEIGGRSYWLDGTGLGARLEDIGDTPNFRNVLPLRTAGTGLMPLPTHANARPDVVVTTDYDQSLSLDLPSVFRTEMRLRGGTASMVNAAVAQAADKQKREMVEQLVRQRLGQAQITDSALAYDPVNGTATITASGLLTTNWRREDKRMRLGLGQVIDGVGFDPDRSRPAWRMLPVATAAPESTAYRTTIHLPDAGRGFALEGDQTLAVTLAGTAITRKAALAGGTVTIDERSDSSGVEIAPDAIAAERSKLALARTRDIRAVAPADLPPRWQVVRAGSRARFAPLEAAYAKAIARSAADDPTDTSGLESRMSFRRGIYDYRGAIEDATRILAIGETADRLIQRSALYSQVGDTAKALADAQAAVKLDPGSNDAVARLAFAEADLGRYAPALARLQERIDQGGKERFGIVNSRAELMARSGDTPGAIAALDAAITERPGDPLLLNGRCWIKGTRNVQLDTALKDCTKAIELADNPAAALDSRAMVYWRMGHTDDALADLDAALESAPGSSSSLFLRGVVRRKAGNVAGAESDLGGARLIEPKVDAEYAGYGVTP